MKCGLARTVNRLFVCLFAFLFVCVSVRPFVECDLVTGEGVVCVSKVVLYLVLF